MIELISGELLGVLAKWIFCRSRYPCHRLFQRFRGVGRSAFDDGTDDGPRIAQGEERPRIPESDDHYGDCVGRVYNDLIEFRLIDRDNVQLR